MVDARSWAIPNSPGFIAAYKLLDEVRVAGIASEAGKKKLAQVKLLIVEHLKKEDAELYPAFEQHCSG